MRTKNSLSVVAAAVIMASCAKDTSDKDTQVNPPGATDLSTLVMPASFNWSSSMKGELNLTIKAPEYLTTENQWVEIRDEEGNIIDRSKVSGNIASFYLNVPQNDTRIFAHYPNTGESMEITSTGNRAFTLAEVDLAKADLDNLKKGLTLSGSPVSTKGKTAGINLVINGDFESSASFGSDTRAPEKLRSLGSWYSQNTNTHIKDVGGSNVFSSSASGNAKIFQAFEVEGQYQYDFAYDFSGGARIIYMIFNESGGVIGYAVANKSGSTATLNLQMPEAAKFLQLYTVAAGSEWIDNISVAKVDEPDTDADGIIDRLDDYPNDANKSQAVYFPSIGRQTVAFEDLWPSMGDFDFNDMVVSNLVEYGYSPSGDLVDATFKVKINAVGAGIPNGLAVVLLQPNGQPFGQNIIAGMSGDAAQDPDVTNGFIVFQDVKDALDHYYMNNGQGPSGEPKELVFTVTFNSNAGQTHLLPDFYIFRSAERGREIHLKGFGPTAAADPSLLGTGSDHNGTYVTESGLPWALEIVYPGTIFFKHPLEKVDILEAYPRFQQWAESSGTSQTGWMVFPATGKVFEN